MKKSFEKILSGYQEFRKKYAAGDHSVMHDLACHGQKPEFMMVACSDSRVDPAVILQCDPGDLFTVRNVANIVPPYESDGGYHGTSAALEYGVCYLQVKHLVILGHSQCGGIDALLHSENIQQQNDFIGKWVSTIKTCDSIEDTNTAAKKALAESHKNCLTFPWIKERVEQNKLAIHLWFFDIEQGKIMAYSFDEKKYLPL